MESDKSVLLNDVLILRLANGGRYRVRKVNYVMRGEAGECPAAYIHYEFLYFEKGSEEHSKPKSFVLGNIQGAQLLSELHGWCNFFSDIPVFLMEGKVHTEYIDVEKD